MLHLFEDIIYVLEPLSASMTEMEVILTCRSSEHSAHTLKCW